jgi:hypothetical protein
MNRPSLPDDRVRPDRGDVPSPRWRRPGILPAVVVAVLVLFSLVLIQRPDVEEERSRLEAVEVSERFIEAHNNRDYETALSLVADSALISMNPAFGVDEIQMAIVWLEATGWVMVDNGCTVTRRVASSGDEPVHVLCALAHESEWSKALGHDPDSRGALTLDVASGKITSALLSSAPMSFRSQTVLAFEGWLSDTHPDDLDEMFVYYPDLPSLSPESIDLWRRHTESFVAAQED